MCSIAIPSACLHSAIGYVTPPDKMDGKEKEIFEAHDAERAAARELRENKRLKESDSLPLSQTAVMGR
ncbi:MAG: hypothetical protein P8Y45_20420 [Exilibacterium sp.]